MKFFRINNVSPKLLNIIIALMYLPDISTAATTPHEPNNSLADATFVAVNATQKTYAFDYAGDEDWFEFYALKEYPYDIEIPDKSVGKGINPAIEIYNEQGVVEVGLFDFNFAGEGELLSWRNVPKDGLYYVRVTNQQKNFNVDNRYDLKVYLPLLPNNLSVKGKILNQCSQKAISRAAIQSSANVPVLSNKNGEFNLTFPNGTYTLTANVTGYEQQSQTVSLNEQDKEKYVDQSVTFALTPKGSCQPAQAPIPAIPDPQPTPIVIPKPEPVATFNEQTGELWIKDVRVADDRITAKLHLRGDKLKLIETQPINAHFYNAPAFYDFNTLLADVPSVSAYGKIWRIKMKNIAGNDYLFELANVEELP